MRVNMEVKSDWRFWASGTDINHVLDAVRKIIPEHKDYMTRVSFGDREDEFEPERVTVKDVTVSELAVLLPACLELPDQSRIGVDYGISVQLTDSTVDKPYKGAFESWAALHHHDHGSSKEMSQESMLIQADEVSEALRKRIDRAMDVLDPRRAEG